MAACFPLLRSESLKHMRLELKPVRLTAAMGKATEPLFMQEAQIVHGTVAVGFDHGGKEFRVEPLHLNGQRR